MNGSPVSADTSKWSGTITSRTRAGSVRVGVSVGGQYAGVGWQAATSSQNAPIVAVRPAGNAGERALAELGCQARSVGRHPNLLHDRTIRGTAGGSLQLVPQACTPTPENTPLARVPPR